MSSFPRSQGPLRKTDQRDGVDRDYQRLIGHYSAVPSDATAIIPGETFRKKKPAQDLTPFKPINTLSGKRKESGPVRTQGRISRRAGFQTYSRNRAPHFQNTREFEAFERPVKRQRRGQASVSSGDMGSDDDIIEQASFSPLGSSSAPKRVPGSSETGHFLGARGRHSNGNDFDEHRLAEHDTRFNPRREHRQSFHSGRVGDERFTRTAANQRKSTALCTSAEQAGSEYQPRGSKPRVMESVEIPTLRRSTHRRRSPSLQHQFIAADGTHRAWNVRDSQSPDVLQGERTTNISTLAVQNPKWYEDRSGVFLRSSPSDIQPTSFIGSQKKLFEATSVRAGPEMWLVSPGRAITVTLDTARNTLGMNGRGPDSEGSEIPLSSIRLAVRSDDPSRKVTLRMRDGSVCRRVDIELPSEEDMDSLCLMLKQKQIEVQNKPSKWMDDAFKRGEGTADIYKPKHIRPRRRSGEKLEVQRVKEPRRAKLSTSLRDYDGNTADEFTTTWKYSNKSAITEKASASLNSIVRSHQNDVDSGAGSSSGNKRSPSTRAQMMRSMRDREASEAIVCDDENDGHGDLPTLEITPGKWKRPLVYPRFGKKMAEVDAQDRERLRDGEFLNDNLIGFYIRFIQEHLSRTNKDVAKRIYFFNSYFFATLTNTSRGQRGVNYEGVQKWTRNVDLFSYDYIVVPINETAHWYVAIICNLPSLLKAGQLSCMPGASDVGSRASSEVRQTPESPNSARLLAEAAERNNKEVLAEEEMTRQAFITTSMAEGDTSNCPKEDTTDEWPKYEENPLPLPVRFSPSHKARGVKTALGRAVECAGPPQTREEETHPRHTRRSTCQPTIITFDSLNLGRTPTINTLRAYLCEEAKSKRGISIDRNKIKGMKAQQIPQQGNFSDCGLYLLAYLEKFVQSPDDFAARLLRKEMRVSTDWPPLEPGHLRRRLRDFLDKLYDEQERLSLEEASRGETMADSQPISFLLGPKLAESESEREEPSRKEPVGLPEDDHHRSDSKKQMNYPTGHIQQDNPTEGDQYDCSVTGKMRCTDQQDQEHDILRSLREIEVVDSQNIDEVAYRTSNVQVIPEPGNDAIGESAFTEEKSGGDKIIEIQVIGTPSPKSSVVQKMRNPRSVKRY